MFELPLSGFATDVDVGARTEPYTGVYKRIRVYTNICNEED